MSWSSTNSLSLASPKSKRRFRSTLLSRSRAAKAPGGPDDYEPPRRKSILQLRTEYFYPEVIVRFDRLTGHLEFESISLGTQSVEVGIDDVERHLRRR